MSDYKADSYPAAAPAPAPYYTTQSPQQVEADKASQLSLIFGIVGLFFAGIIFGPLAIVQAKKAEQLGRAATAGKVLGWICTIWAALWTLGVLMMLLGGGLLAAGM